MKPLRVLIMALLGLVLVGGVALGLLAWRAGAWLRTVAQEALQSRLVLQVTLTEAVQWQLWPHGQLRFRGLVLHDAHGAPQVAVDEIVAGFTFGDLLADRPRIAEVAVRGLHLKVDIDEQGRPSPLAWLPPAAPTPRSGRALPAVVIERLTLTGTEVRVDDPVRNVRLRAWLPRLAAGPVALGEGGRLRLTAQIELAAPLAGELAVEGETGYRFDAQGFRLDTATTAFSGQWNRVWRLAEGRVHIGAARVGADADWHIEAAELSAQVDGPQGPLALSAVIDRAVRADTRWRATGRAALAAPRLDIDAETVFQVETDRLSGTLAGRLADSALEGRWFWPRTAGGTLDLQLTIDSLDLDRLRARLPSADTQGELPRWQNWPLTAELWVGRLRLGGMESRNVRLSLQDLPASR